MEGNKCELTWTNLEMVAAEQRRIIKNSSGQIRPYTLTAILGPSGSGKTSLLNALAGRIKADQILTGDIKANGEKRDQENWSKTVAYVEQAFHAYAWQTVYETLEFAAKIKLINKDKIKDHVEELIDMLRLNSSRDTFIGKLSGGERIRVSMGIELLGDPLVLLVDEPLSGLDSFNAINILDILKSISSTGKTILITIHQPSYLMMNYFDQIMLMCQGHTVYQGTLDNCIRFFEDCGFELPAKTTPTDFFLSILSIDNKNEKEKEDSLKRIETIRKEWNFIKPEQELTITDEIRVSGKEKSAYHLKILISRYLKNYIRNTEYVKFKIFQKILTAMLFGATFFSTGLENADIFAFRGIMTFTFQSELFGISTPVMTTFIQDKKVLLRECSSGMYSGYEAYFARLTSDFILSSIFAVPFHLFIYLVVGFPLKLKVILRLYLILLFLINYSVSFGLTVGTLVSTPQAAHTLGTTLNASVLLYSGSLINPKKLPWLVSKLVWFSPAHYVFRSLVFNQVESIPYKMRKSCTTVSNPRTIIDFGLEGIGIYTSLLVLFLMTILIQQIGAYILSVKSNYNLKVSKPKKIEV